VTAPLRVCEAPRGRVVPAGDAAFLGWLGGPVLLRVPGRDRSRTRAVVTLLHGNEPSGLRALRAWLAGDAEPATDAVCLVACVEAALAEPGFAFRMLPGRRDLNRCFRSPFEGAEGALAAAILASLRQARPEALVDLHNNTGHNPVYGVGGVADGAHLALVGLFGERFVQSDLRLGTLGEALEAELPCVTIECGRAGDPVADAAALAGLGAFLGRERLPACAERPMTILHRPLRVALRPGVSVAFADAPDPRADLTLAADVDRHNFERLPAGSAIGWLRPGRPWPLDARGADAREVSRELFAADGGCLRTRREGVPIMMTTSPAIAAADCLFYLAQPREP
jgi:hypothetical protein